jgi:uncharacterized protein (TIGR02421 family)
LPFFCIYRRPPRAEDGGTELLVTTEASYLTATGGRAIHPGLSELVRRIAETLTVEFGAVLIIELWSASDDTEASLAEGEPTPRFTIFAPRDEYLTPFVEAFSGSLSRVKVRKQRAVVRVTRSQRTCPKALPAILSATVAQELKCVTLGLEVGAVYRDPSTGQVFPLVLRELRRGLSRALKRAFFEFARTRTTHRPEHFHVLGRRAVVKAVWQVDRLLADLAGQFDLLLLTTPVNADQAWREFQRNRFDRTPVFRYRPIPLDPVILKRKLYAIPIERIEDPALALLFRQKQDELDKQITMLLERNTKRFLYGSQQLYGGVSEELMELASNLLRQLPARSHDDSAGGYLGAGAFAKRAEEEIEYYRAQLPEVDASVQIRDDMMSGLMVSRGSLLIGKKTRIPLARVEALIQHEVGTHVLTYYNGRAQPIRQLYSGLAGYEASQEGLAVLSEYLVGGLSRPRLRLLAARVLAARHLIDGASFIDCFRLLDRDYRFERQTAYTITMRVFRGGGLTKDAVYLLGLHQLLGYLNGGGELEPFFIGKMAIGHVPIVKELRWRGVLGKPPLTPRYMTQPGPSARLEQARNLTSLLDLVRKDQV